MRHARATHAPRTRHARPSSLTCQAIALRGAGDGSEATGAAYLSLLCFAPAWAIGLLQLAVDRIFAARRDRSALVAYLGTPYRLRSNEKFYGGRHARVPWAVLFWAAVGLSAALLAYSVIDKPAMGGWKSFAAPRHRLKRPHENGLCLLAVASVRPPSLRAQGAPSRPRAQPGTLCSPRTCCSS